VTPVTTGATGTIPYHSNSTWATYWENTNNKKQPHWAFNTHSRK